MHRTRPKILTCKALAPLLRPWLRPGTEVVELDIGLHLSPNRLRGELLNRVGELEEDGGVILLGYGLCGRAVEGVFSRKSRLVLPRVDDCVGVMLGSRRRHMDLLDRCSGSYFLCSHWLDTEMNIFEQMYKQMGNIPEYRRSEMVKLALKHYHTLAFMQVPGGDCAGIARGREMAARHGLDFRIHTADLGLLRKLVRGPWSPEEFVIVEPGCAITLF